MFAPSSPALKFIAINSINKNIPPAFLRHINFDSRHWRMEEIRICQHIKQSFDSHNSRGLVSEINTQTQVRRSAVVLTRGLGAKQAERFAEGLCGPQG